MKVMVERILLWFGGNGRASEIYSHCVGKLHLLLHGLSAGCTR